MATRTLAAVRSEVAQTLSRYASAIDKLDYDEVAACFAHDVEAAYAGRGTVRGRDEVVSSLREARGTHATMHAVTNVVISLVGKAVQSESYAIAVHMPPQDNPNAQVRLRGLRYRDELVEVDRSWVIRRRSHELCWAVELPAQVAQNG